MRRMLWVIGSVLLVATAATGCAREADDDVAAMIEGTTRSEYVDAMAWSAAEAGSYSFSTEENECIADGYVDAIGLDELRDKVTPQEIRDDPETDHVDWGIELSRPQAQDLYQTMRSCADLAPLFSGIVGAFGADVSADAPECLAQSVDEDVLEELMVGTIIDGDDFQATEELAGSIYDWLAGCIDFRELLLAQIAENAPPDAMACIESRLDDEILKRLVIAGMTGDESVGSEMAETFQDCEPGPPPIET